MGGAIVPGPAAPKSKIERRTCQGTPAERDTVPMPSPSPLQLRIELANIDRGLDLVAKLIVDRDPDTPPEHVILRVLAWCLFHEEGLRIADGPPRRDLPDLSVTRLDGKPATYIACGAADGEE